MKKTFFLLILIVTIAGIFFSCKKEKSCEGCRETNKPPIAIAGPDQVIILPSDSISLDGSVSSDPDGTISEWLWKKISGPVSFIINNSSASNSVVKNLVKGVYQFELKVTDNGGLSAKDTMQVIVDDPSQPNRPPVANAGADQTITLPTNNVSVNGSGSTDPDNNIIAYLWTKISGPTSFIVLSSTNAQTFINDLVPGRYQFELKVTDAGGLFSKDTVYITVNNQVSTSLPCDSNSAHWTRFRYLPVDEFFFSPRNWFNGDNFLMGIDNTVFAVSNKGRVWKYNTQGDMWQMIGDFPENMSSMPIVFSINGKGYCISDGHCWQYTPSTNQWVIKNAPSGNVYAPLVINGKVYFRKGNNQFVEYDPLLDSFVDKTNCPSTVPLVGSFVIDGYGFHVYENGQCWKYNAANDSWQQKASLSNAVYLGASTGFSLNTSGYIIGDLNGQAYNTNLPMTLYRYNSISDTWFQCTSEEFNGDGVYGISTISFNGLVYVGLGYNNGDFNAIDFWKFQ